MRHAWHAAMAAALLLGSAATLRAQSVAPPPRGQSIVCLRPQPLAACRVYPVVEFGGARRLGRADGAGAWLVTSSAGVLVNIAPNEAVGTALVFAGNDGETWGVAGRYRHWLSRRQSLDLELGLPTGVRQLPSVPRVNVVRPSVSLSAKLALADWLGLQSRLEVLTYCENVSCPTKGTDVGPYIGLEGRGAVGVVLIPLVLLGILIGVTATGAGGLGF